MKEEDRGRAQNEALFRALNEEIERFTSENQRGSWIDLVCECSSRGCMQVVSVTRTEYERVREFSTWFIVAPGHEDLEIEAIVARHDNHLVVEKRGEAAAVAERTDPRAPG
jgi:hypothetical protein